MKQNWNRVIFIVWDTYDYQAPVMTAHYIMKNKVNEQLVTASVLRFKNLYLKNAVPN